MKKIGIITYYGVHNHGALLQAYALKTTIETLGDYKVFFVPFNRDYSYISEKHASKYKISLRSIPFFFKYCKSVGFKNIFFNLSKRNKLQKFRKRYFSFCQKVCENNCDFYIVGSDEVFSVDIGFNPIMYGIGISQSIASYAGSFGSTNIDDIHNKNLATEISKGLNNFTFLSVRDSNSLSIINELCPSRDVELVCDPVLLYGYKNVIKKNTRNNKSKYLLIYSYDKNMNDINEINLIKSFAKENKMTIISAGFFHKWADKNINADPFQLIELFRDAEFVLTDTFHGTVLSLITNTKFATKLRGNNNKLQFLLEQHELTNRILHDFKDLSSFYLKGIDFNKINKFIDINKNKSLLFLRKILEDGKIN